MFFSIPSNKIVDIIIKYLLFNLNYILILLAGLISKPTIHLTILIVLSILGLSIQNTLRIKNKDIRDNGTSLIYVEGLEQLMWIAVTMISIGIIANCALIALIFYYANPNSIWSVTLLTLASFKEITIFINDYCAYCRYRDIIVESKSYGSHHVGYNTI